MRPPRPAPPTRRACLGALVSGLAALTTGNNYYSFKLSARDTHGSADGPDVAPDGARVAYVAVMNRDGSGQRQLTHRPVACGRVRCSPDGRQIAFVSFEGPYPQRFLIPAAGGEPRQLTRLRGAVYALAWRPR